MSKLYIHVEGGSVQGVESDDPDAFKNIQVFVVDHDVEGMDEDDRDVLVFRDGKEDEASVEEQYIEETDIVDFRKANA